MNHFEYVICYAESIDPTVLGAYEQIYVVKDRPLWQKGRINLPGGKIEESDDSPLAAACRELLEETGMPWFSEEVAGSIYGGDDLGSFRIHVVKFKVPRVAIRPQQGETEQFFWSTWDSVRRDTRILPNLNVMIPLLEKNVFGWDIEDINFNPDKRPYELKVNLA